MIREAKLSDIKQIQIVRNSVKENKLSNPALVSDADCEEFMFTRGKGWVCEIGNTVVGFAIADLKDNNIWALFLHPDFENKGIGRLLHNRMLNWYFAQGKEFVWLGTAPNTRAEMFYTKMGWTKTGTHGKGEVKFEMTSKTWKDFYTNISIDFPLTSSGAASEAFKAKGISSFKEACAYIKSLPYKRNANKTDVLCSIKDGWGTCGSKHAILKQLAIENGVDKIKLVICMLRMNKNNTPNVAGILNKYELSYIPEAHNYLLFNGKILDYTKPDFGPDNFILDIISETEILPAQIADFKVAFHKEVLKQWLTEHPEVKYTLDEIWAIREECIANF